MQRFRVETTIVPVAVLPIFGIVGQPVGKGVLTLAERRYDQFARREERAYVFRDALLPRRFVFGAVLVVQNAVPVEFSIFEFADVRRAGRERERCAAF